MLREQYKMEMRDLSGRPRSPMATRGGGGIMSSLREFDLFPRLVAEEELEFSPSDSDSLGGGSRPRPIGASASRGRAQHLPDMNLGAMKRQ